MENNLKKTHLEISPDVDVKSPKNKKVVKVKNGGNIEDNSVQQSANTITNDTHVHNHITQEIKVTDKQLATLLGNANKDLLVPLKQKLMEVPEEKLIKAFKDVSPLFLATYASNNMAREQKNALINDSLDEALKKQSIQVMSFLSKKDISLFKIINEIKRLIFNYLRWNFDRDFKSFERILLVNNITDKTEYFKKNINKILDSIIQKISYFKHIYGNIQFSTFENLNNNNLLMSDGLSCYPLKELVCKLFISESNDKTKNDEYMNENIELRTQQNRNKWTHWFSEDKFKGTFVIEIFQKIRIVLKDLPYGPAKDMNAKYENLYWMITNLGNVVLTSIEE